MPRRLTCRSLLYTPLWCVHFCCPGEHCSVCFRQTKKDFGCLLWVMDYVSTYHNVMWYFGCVECRTAFGMPHWFLAVCVGVNDGYVCFVVNILLPVRLTMLICCWLWVMAACVVNGTLVIKPVMLYLKLLLCMLILAHKGSHDGRLLNFGKYVT